MDPNLALKTEIFGKNGLINHEFKKIGSLSPEEKKIFASTINKSKQELQDIIRHKENEVLNKNLNEYNNVYEIIIFTVVFQ